MSRNSRPLLEIRNATKVFSSGGGLFGSKSEVVALQDFNLIIEETPATLITIAGESGSGKTTLANVILGNTRLTSGDILYRGQPLAAMKGRQWLDYRRNIQAVFQDPYSVYNPFYRADHIFHLVLKHFKLARSQAEARAMIEEALNVVGLGTEVLSKYPHQLSGGQRQRVMMARAYLIKPRLIVADEPVSMVDVSLRASILDVMLRLKNEHNISFLYITHDLSTAYQVGDTIFILYQGAIIEKGVTTDVIDHPHHPYARLLIDSVPQPETDSKWSDTIELPTEEESRAFGATGCRFYPRCPQRMDRCLEKQPPLFAVSDSGHEAACYLYETDTVAVRQNKT